MNVLFFGFSSNSHCPKMYRLYDDTVDDLIYNLFAFAGNRFHPAIDSSQSQSQANVTSPSKRHLPPTPEASPKALDASPRGYVTMTGSDVYHSPLRHFKAESRDDGALVSSLVQSLAGSSSSGPHCYLNMINAC